jgi:hypothetical protein
MLTYVALLALAVAAVGGHINQNQQTQIKSLLPYADVC